MNKQIRPGVYWVGAVDREIRTFHGSEFSTPHGTTYNAYLIQDEKTILIDTVAKEFTAQFLKNIESITPFAKIDAVVVNHAEVDHSGALPALMDILKDKPIYCSPNGLVSIKGHFHRDWRFLPVKTGDRLSLGSRELLFIEAPMLHWPDSMFTYLGEDGILFSSDAFGQHLATEELFNHLVSPSDLSSESLRYYASIVSPFSEQVLKKIEEISSKNWQLKVIAPSHGVIWVDNPQQIVQLYQRWASGYQENQVTIVYDTMWAGTERMAEAIARGIKEAGPTLGVELFHLGHSDRNDVVAEIFRSRGLLLGSPTVNRGMLSSVAGLLEMLKGLRLKGKKAAAFGSFGWSGEAIRLMKDRLVEAGLEIMSDGIACRWRPDDRSLEKCKAFGREIAAQLT